MTEHRNQVDPAFAASLMRGMTQRRVSRRDLIKYGGATVGTLSLASILAACGGDRSAERAAKPHRADTVDFGAEPGSRDQLRQLAPLHRLGQRHRDGGPDQPIAGHVRGGDRHPRQLQRRDPGQRLVLRRAASAAAGWAGHRPRHHRDHERSRVHGAYGQRVDHRARPRPTPELRRQRGRLGEGSRLRPRQQVLHGLAVGPDRRRLGTPTKSVSRSRSSTT